MLKKETWPDFSDTNAPKEVIDAYLKAATEVGLDLTDPDNQEWLEEHLLRGSTGGAIEVFLRLKQQDRQMDE
jgi:hypothetical protein